MINVIALILGVSMFIALMSVLRIWITWGSGMRIEDNLQYIKEMFLSTFIGIWMVVLILAIAVNLIGWSLYNMTGGAG